MRLEAKDALSLIGGAIKTLRDFAGHSVHAVAGIGNPQRFSTCCGVRHRGGRHPLRIMRACRPPIFPFPDGRPVLMTEKDAVKCAGFAGSAALVCAGDREFRRRRIEASARHRDSSHDAAHVARVRGCFHG